MYTNYNINQLTLNLSTEFIPKENHVACFINELVESLQINDPYLFGRPREYDLSALLKLVLFAYTRETFTSRKIQRLAEENLYARWLTQESEPFLSDNCPLLCLKRCRRTDQQKLGFLDSLSSGTQSD